MRKGKKHSQFKGVTTTPYGKWVARIRVKKAGIYLGTFNTEIAAAAAYDEAAVKYFGDFAAPNGVINCPA